MTKKSPFFLLAALFVLFASCEGQMGAQSKKPNKEITLSIIKPNAVEENHIGEILAIFEKNGLRIAALKMVDLTEERAKEFYAEHRERSFFEELAAFMSSGPVVALVLEGDDAVAKNRELMGATDPKRAEEGTIRKLFAESVSANAVHGSDSAESAQREIRFFFAPEELHPRF